MILSYGARNFERPLRAVWVNGAVLHCSKAAPRPVPTFGHGSVQASNVQMNCNAVGPKLQRGSTLISNLSSSA